MQIQVEDIKASARIAVYERYNLADWAVFDVTSKSPGVYRFHLVNETPGGDWVHSFTMRTSSYPHRFWKTNRIVVLL